MRELSKYDVVLIVDAKKPVAMFGYEKGPVDLIPLPEESVWEIDRGFDVDAAIDLLYREVGAERIRPGVNCRGVFVTSERRPPKPARPDAKLTASAMCSSIARHQPAGCIIVDESLTSGTNYYEASKGKPDPMRPCRMHSLRTCADGPPPPSSSVPAEGCPAFSHLFQTGGAIGIGPPLALGCAVACPHRRVINIQADGSGLYSVQALWSQAKENADVVTIVCANGRYNILNLELEKQKVTSSSHARNLTSLDNPPVGWAKIAEGFGVKASIATTVEEFDASLAEALGRSGPSLIEARLG